MSHIEVPSTMTDGEAIGLHCFVLGWIPLLIDGHRGEIVVIPKEHGDGVDVEFSLRGPRAQHRVVTTSVGSKFSTPRAWVNGRSRYGNNADFLIGIGNLYAAQRAGESPRRGLAYEVRYRFAKMRMKLPYDFG